MVLAVERIPFVFGAGEVFLVVLTTLIIFLILGRRLYRDLRGGKSV